METQVTLTAAERRLIIDVLEAVPVRGVDQMRVVVGLAVKLRTIDPLLGKENLNAGSDQAIPDDGSQSEA